MIASSHLISDTGIKIEDLERVCAECTNELMDNEVGYFINGELYCDNCGILYDDNGR